MTIEQDGRFGEKLAREWFKSHGLSCFQADWITKFGEVYCLYEIKFQEPFEPPPFWGHGLPLWQVRARLEFQAATSVRACLLVFDKKTGATYSQFFDELEQGPHFDTKGNQPRRVYPLTSFIERQPWREQQAS
jgi:hypothetical protein